MKPNKLIQRERRNQYKTLRKLRKARDIASRKTKNKKQAWRLSMVRRRFQTDSYGATKNELAYLIYNYMPNHLRPQKPTKINDRLFLEKR